MADGEIILGVDVDARQAEEKIQRLTNELAKLKINNSNLSPKLREISKEAGLCEQHILRLKNALRNANDSTVIDKINKEIKVNEQYLETLTNEYSKLLTKKLEIKDAIKGINKEIGNVRWRAPKRDQIASIAANNFTRTMGAETAEVVRNERKMAAAMAPLSKAFYKLSDVARNALGGIAHSFRRIIRLAASAFIFNVMSAGFRSMSKWITHLLYLDQEFVGSLRQIKANLLTAFAPIYQAVLPLLKKMGQAIVWVTQYLAKLISLLTGTSLEVNQQSARNMDFEVRRSIALEKASKRRAKNDKKRNKEAKDLNKSLAKFDKLDVWKKDKTSGSDKLDKIKGLKKGSKGLGGLEDLDIPESKLEFKKLEDWNTSALEWAENTNAFINKLKETPKNIDKQLDKLDKIKPGSKKFIKNLGIGATITTGLGLLTKGKIFKPIGKFLIGGAKVLTSTFKGVKNFAKPLFGGIKNSFKPIAKGIKGGFKMPAGNLKNGFQITKAASNPFWKGLKEGSKQIGYGVKEAFKPIKEWSKKYFNKGTLGAIKTFAKAHPAITGAVGVGALATYGAKKYFGYKDWKGKLPEEQKKGKSGWQLFKEYFGKTWGTDILDMAAFFGFGKSSEEQIQEGEERYKKWLSSQPEDLKKNKSEQELMKKYLKESTATIANKNEEKKEEKKPYFSIPGFGRINLNTGKTDNPPIELDWEKNIENWANDIKEKLKPAWENFKDFFKDHGEESKLLSDWEKEQKELEENLGKLGEKFKKFFNDTGEESKSLWEKAKGKFDGWKKWLGEKFDDTKKWAGEQFEWIGKESKKMWEAMKQAPKSALNWLLEQTEKLLNKIIWGINWFIKQANKISFDFGGQHFGISIPEISEVKIPRLAKGSVLKGGNPFLAWVNDQPRGQTNIETPLDTIVRAFKEVSGNNSNQNIVIEANGDLGSIIREFNFKLKDENIRVGRDLMIPAGTI